MDLADILGLKTSFVVNYDEQFCQLLPNCPLSFHDKRNELLKIHVRGKGLQKRENERFEKNFTCSCGSCPSMVNCPRTFWKKPIMWNIIQKHNAIRKVKSFAQFCPSPAHKNIKSNSMPTKVILLAFCARKFSCLKHKGQAVAVLWWCVGSTKNIS